MGLTKTRAAMMGIGAAEEPDAFAELVDASRKPPPTTDMGGPLAERRSISQQVAGRITAMNK